MLLTFWLLVLLSFILPQFGALLLIFVRMKFFRQPNAFPVTDIGLHNTLKTQFGLDRKLTVEEIISWQPIGEAGKLILFFICDC